MQPTLCHYRPPFPCNAIIANQISFSELIQKSIGSVWAAALVRYENQIGNVTFTQILVLPQRFIVRWNGLDALSPDHMRMAWEQMQGLGNCAKGQKNRLQHC